MNELREKEKNGLGDYFFTLLKNYRDYTDWDFMELSVVKSSTPWISSKIWSSKEILDQILEELARGGLVRISPDWKCDHSSDGGAFFKVIRSDELITRDPGN